MSVALIPVICEQCGRVFVSSGVFAGTATNIAMTGSRVGPCPYCGSVGRIPDGIYNLSEVVTTFLAAPSLPVEDLEKLRALFERATMTDASLDDVAAAIERELPSLAGFAEWLRQAGLFVTKYALLPFLVGLLLLLIEHRMQQPTLTPDQVEQIIERVQREQPPPPPEAPRAH
jgi:hypothetical protein